MRKKLLALCMFSVLLAMVIGISAGSTHPLDEVYAKAGKAAPSADAAQVLRRMSLQLRGNIPAVAEVREVEANPAALDRYATLYISDPDFAHYWGTYFASVLREQTKGRKTKYASFLHYVASSLHQNKPYDAWVREMLTAKGSAEENPAVDMYLRDGADPLQVAEFVGRAFYGSRVSCARCHDHPHMDFSRRDYYGLAAFFSQQFEVRGAWDPAFMGGNAVPREAMENLPEQKKREMEEKWREWQRDVWGKMSKEEREAWRKKHEVKFAAVHFSPDLGIRFPKSDDAPGGDLVAPRFPDGKTPRIRPGEDRRAVFAAWLTSPENSRFRKVLINRVWTRLMGWSFFTPLDDWNNETKMQGEEILDHLDKVFLEKNCRIKDLVYYIVTSNAYKRSAPGPASADKSSAIVYFQPVRLDPDQLFNSVLRAGGALEVKTGELRERSAELPGLMGRGQVLLPQENQKTYTNAFEIPRPADERSILSVFGSGDRVDITDDDRTITVEQVLTLQNGRFTGRISFDYGKPGSAVHQEYERTKDLNQTFELVYRSMLSRRMKDSEKAGLAQVAAMRIGREKGDYRPELMQDLVWGIFNSQEFLHVR